MLVLLCNVCGIVVAGGLVVFLQVWASVAKTSAPAETVLATIQESVCNSVALCWNGCCIFCVLGCVWLHCISSVSGNTRHGGMCCFPLLERRLATFASVIVLGQLRMRIRTGVYGWPIWTYPIYPRIVFTSPHRHLFIQAWFVICSKSSGVYVQT